MPVLESDFQHFVSLVCEEVDSPLSLSVFLLMKHGEWEQLVSKRVHPHDYECRYHDGIERYRRDSVATELLRKCEISVPGLDPEAAALESWYVAEAECYKTNQRFRNLREFYPSAIYPEITGVKAILRRSSRFIKRVLHSLPATLDGRFGPGATFESSDYSVRSFTSYDKLRNPWTITRDMAPFADHVIWETALGPVLAVTHPTRLLHEVRGDKLRFVPKTAQTHRPISIGPGANVWAQLAIGQCIRSRLKRAGIDLQSAQELHRTLAQESSLADNFVTIDLRSASDTIASGLVEYLLSDVPEWYHLLNALRCKYTCVNGKTGTWKLLEKFSAMGCGFTFELETLIFLSLAHACGGNVGVDTFVYGDDIIVPKEIAEDLLSYLAFCGFTPNTSKTYLSGHFRESCGGDFMDGYNVRAWNCQKQPSSPHEWISAHNALYAIQERFGWRRFRRSMKYAISRIPTRLRVFGPPELGDCCLHSRSPLRWKIKEQHSIRRILVIQRRFQKNRLQTHRGLILEREVGLASALIGLPSDYLTPRNGQEYPCVTRYVCYS